MSERTDQERFAWCFLNSVGTDFYNMREKGVDVGVGTPGIGDVRFASRSIKSGKHAITAWRKCVDELMDKEEA